MPPSAAKVNEITFGKCVDLEMVCEEPMDIGIPCRTASTLR